MIQRKRGKGFMLIEAGVEYDEDVSSDDVTSALQDGTLRAFEDPETGELTATYQDWTNFKRELAARKLTAAFMSDVEDVLANMGVPFTAELVHDISRRCAVTATNRYMDSWMPVGG